MRTTLTLDDDVLDKAKAVAARMKTPFRRVVNEALRVGLQSVEKPGIARAYRTKPGKLGLKPGMNLDNIQELISRLEGEEHR